MSDSLRGQILLASPLLRDPNFIRSAVYLCAHDEHGALGVVLNRPSPIAVEDVMERWGPLMSEPPSLFTGGPVELESAIALGWLTDRAPEDGRLALVTPPIAMLDLNRGPDELAPHLAAARVFLGYSGWTAGQLESELDDEAWIVVDAMPTDVFSIRPDRLWIDLLRRQGGSTAMQSSFPDDPTQN